VDKSIFEGIQSPAEARNTTPPTHLDLSPGEHCSCQVRPHPALFHFYEKGGNSKQDVRPAPTCSWKGNRVLSMNVQSRLGRPAPSQLEEKRDRKEKASLTLRSEYDVSREGDIAPSYHPKKMKTERKEASRQSLKRGGSKQCMRFEKRVRRNQVVHRRGRRATEIG